MIALLALLFLVKIMTCKEVEKIIPSFIDRTLDEDRLEELMEHMDTCEICKEEFSIQLLVSEGMERLESGSSFNLSHSVKRRMEMGRNQLRTKEKLNRILLFVVAISLGHMHLALFLCKGIVNFGKNSVDRWTQYHK